MFLSLWVGVRWFAGGHGSFFAFSNCFVHIFTYFYYMVSAMGPGYKVGSFVVWDLLIHSYSIISEVHLVEEAPD